MYGRAPSHRAALKSVVIERTAPRAGLLLTVAFTVAFWVAAAHFFAQAFGYPLTGTTLANVAIVLSIVLGAVVAPVFLGGESR